MLSIKHQEASHGKYDHISCNTPSFESFYVNKCNWCKYVNDDSYYGAQGEGPTSELLGL